MSIALTSAFNPGDNDPGKTYTHMRACRYYYDGSSAESAWHADFEYGFFDMTTWVKGKNLATHVKLEDVSPNNYLTAMLAKEANEGEKVHDAMLRIMEEYAVSAGIIAGTVE